MRGTTPPREDTARLSEGCVPGSIPGGGTNDGLTVNLLACWTHSVLGVGMPNTPTRDLRPPATLPLPHGCITAPALRALATALDRLYAFHRERGGSSPDTPCLTEVKVIGDEVTARVVSGERHFNFLLVRGHWEFR